MAISRGKSSRGAGTKKHGGARKGAGRKPQVFTLLKKRLEAERVEDAEYAFALYSAVMRDPEQPLSLRLECACEVMDRVLGKPKQLSEVSGADGAAILIRLDR